MANEKEKLKTMEDFVEYGTEEYDLMVQLKQELGIKRIKALRKPFMHVASMEGSIKAKELRKNKEYQVEVLMEIFNITEGDLLQVS